MSRVTASRPLDHQYDPTYVSSSSSKPSHSSAAAAAPAASRTMPPTLDVSGRDRHRYFARPLVPLLSAVPSQTIFMSAMMPETGPGDRGTSAAERTRSVAVQTMYRESGTQTDPFTPQHVVVGREVPEVLSLMHMTFANGRLPAGMDEIEEIQRGRDQRSFEASLPPEDNALHLAQRRRMLEGRAREQLRLKKERMHSLEAEKLDEIRQTVAQRQERRARIAERRVDMVRRGHVEDKDATVAEIGVSRIKQLRKMVRARAEFEESIGKMSTGQRTRARDIIDDHANFGSKVYAPLRRNGMMARTGLQHTSQATLHRMTERHGQDMLHGLEEISMRIGGGLNVASTVRRREQQRRAAASHRSSRATRREAEILQQLEHVSRTIQVKKSATLKLQQQHEQTLAQQQMVAIEGDAAAAATKEEGEASATAEAPAAAAEEYHIGKVQRPPTPVAADYDAGEWAGNAEGARAAEERERSVIMLQSLLRGRAVQNMVFDARHRSRELIAELLSADVTAAGRDGADVEDAVTMAMRQGAEDTTDPVVIELDALDGEVISAVLKELAKDDRIGGGGDDDDDNA